ncbi:MAG: hypothetical protein M0P73_05995 [Syntrophobacterales bacterium]|jgi:hypothetical protein|nr:hypothetical protein [Syntrophobacterales bacterium]
MKSRIAKLILVIALSLSLAAASGAALANSVVLSGVPEYEWYYGCSPTSGGMLMGYWAGKGYTQLLPGVTDPLVQSAAVNNNIASTAHITAGGTYGTYLGHTADCIADFMQTDNGGTSGANIATGLTAWTSYAGLTATTTYSEVSYFTDGTFSYAVFENEINTGRPMLLNLATYLISYGKWVGHTVLAYGYEDDMFQIRLSSSTGYVYLTVAGFAVMDTWVNGTGQTSWYDWEGDIVTALLIDGVEWWPYVDLSGYSYGSLYDWQIISGVTYQLVPLPSTLVLLGSGLLILLRLQRKKSSEFIKN